MVHFRSSYRTDLVQVSEFKVKQKLKVKMAVIFVYIFRTNISVVEPLNQSLKVIKHTNSNNLLPSNLNYV